MKIIFKTLLTLLMAAGIVTASSSAAQAGLWGTYDTKHGGVALRTGPATSYELLGRGYSDQSCYILHWQNGESIYGDPIWLYADHHLADGSYWNTIWVSDYYVFW